MHLPLMRLLAFHVQKTVHQAGMQPSSTRQGGRQPHRHGLRGRGRGGLVGQVAGRQLEEGDLAALPVVQHHLGGRVEVGLAAAAQLAARARQLRQEVRRVRPGRQLVCAPLHSRHMT